MVKKHEYFLKLYNYQISAEQEVLKELKDHMADHVEEGHEILESEMSADLKSLKHGKSTRIDNIPLGFIINE